MSQLRTLFSFSCVIAKALGKRPFKRYLELFLDALFFGLVSLVLVYQLWGSLVYQFSVKMFAVLLSSSIVNEGKGNWKQNTIYTSLSVSCLCTCTKVRLGVLLMLQATPSLSGNEITRIKTLNPIANCECRGSELPVQKKIVPLALWREVS